MQERLSGNSSATVSIGSMKPKDVPMMKSKPLRASDRKICSESAPSGTFSMYATWVFATFSHRYCRPS